MKGIVSVAIVVVMVWTSACAVMMAPMLAQPVKAQEKSATNTLRLYGEDSYDAAFPYNDPEGPFDPTNAEAPQRDFVTFNPAFMYHFKNDFFKRAIVVGGRDASEKVFLRQWYVPSYEEPRGEVWTAQEPVYSSDIVNEYTYMLVSTRGEEVWEGHEGETSFILPIADEDDEQIGLDGYDVNNDNESDRVNLIEVTDRNRDGRLDINISTDTMKLHKGDEIQFMDYKAKIESVTASTVVVEVYYQGNEKPEPIEKVTVHYAVGEPPWQIRAGRHSAEEGAPSPIDEPWYLMIWSVDAPNEDVHVAAGRIICTGETFFVDGAEYDVAMIHGREGYLQYITIRNPLPKEEVKLETLTVEKRAVEEGEPLPMLPPFNMVHDIIDDIGGGASSVFDRRIEDQEPLNIRYVEEASEGRFKTELLEIYNETTMGWDSLQTHIKPDEYTEFIYPCEVLLTSSFRSGNDRLTFIYDATADGKGIYIGGVPLELKPFPPYENLPTDPDNDGLYEDINGNGRKDFDDVVAFFQYLEWVPDNEPVECFDFNGNGRIDFDDIVKLFDEL